MRAIKQGNYYAPPIFEFFDLVFRQLCNDSTDLGEYFGHLEDNLLEAGVEKKSLQMVQGLAKHFSTYNILHDFIVNIGTDL